MAVIKTTPPATPPTASTAVPSSPNTEWKLVSARSPPRRSTSPYPQGYRPSSSPNWRVKAPKSLTPPSLLGQRDALTSFSRCSSPGEKSHTSRLRSKSRSPQPDQNASGLPSVAPRGHSHTPQPAAKALTVRRTNSWGARPATRPDKPRKLSLDPNASEFKTGDADSKHKNLLGGKLCMLCTKFFAHAYGLDGHTRKNHDEVIQEAQRLTGCSERAIHETLYGHSYSEQLKSMREQIPNYPPKCRNKGRAAQLQHILANPDQYPFRSFDGNQAAAAPTTDNAAGITSAHDDTTTAGTDAPAKQLANDSTTATPSATATLLSVERVQGAIVGLALAALPLVAQAFKVNM